MFSKPEAMLPGGGARVRPWDRALAARDAFVGTELQQLHPVNINFNNIWQLLGLRFDEKDGRITLGLHWRCLERYAGWLRCFAHVLDQSGNQLSSLDHDLLDGAPPASEWQPGDEGLEMRYLLLEPASLRKAQLSLQPNGYQIAVDADPVVRLRLGIFDTAISARLPLVASSLPVIDNYTAAIVEANQAPGTYLIFQFQPSPVEPCHVVFGKGVELEGCSITSRAGVIWVRLRWNVRQRPAAPVRFFGHAVAARDSSAEALVSFDDEMVLERRGPWPKFEQDIVRSLPAAGPAVLFLRAGVCASMGLQRLEISESTLDRDSSQRCLYLPLPPADTSIQLGEQRPVALQPSDPEIFKEESYTQSYASRLKNLFLHVNTGSLARKRVLELGCGTGQLGQEFAKRGCRVVSVDANPEYIQALRERFPERQAYVLDLEKQDPGVLGGFDIVLCFGVLYHLSRPTAFLKACSRIAPEIYLETIVCDSDEVNYQVAAEAGPDQAYSGFGCRPTPAWIVQTMQSCGFDVQDISSSVANWGGGAPSIFEWTPRNDGSWMRDGAFLRKMFLCLTKNVAMTARW